VRALVVCVAVLDVACPGGAPPTETVFVEDPQAVITSATVRGAAARRVRRAHLMAAMLFGTPGREGRIEASDVRVAAVT